EQREQRDRAPEPLATAAIVPIRVAVHEHTDPGHQRHHQGREPVEPQIKVEVERRQPPQRFRRELTVDDPGELREKPQRRSDRSDRSKQQTIATESTSERQTGHAQHCMQHEEQDHRAMVATTADALPNALPPGSNLERLSQPTEYTNTNDNRFETDA